MSDLPAIDAGRVIADLRELDRRTGGADGAQRLCWGEGWRAARSLLGDLLAELGLEAERDEAGNLWASLAGEDGPGVAVGSHLDSVPNGGWLDGALGVMAALGVLRAGAAEGVAPPRTLTLVDWADEEGARFGRSLFGSSAFSGTLAVDELRRLRDADGRSIAEVLSENGVELGEAARAAGRRGEVAAYLELHIEQGPILEAEGLRAAAVGGCVGIVMGLVRTNQAGTEFLLNEIRQAVWSVDSALPIANPVTMQEILDRSMARTSFILVVLDSPCPTRGRRRLLHTSTQGVDGSTLSKRCGWSKR